jgi:hypothetical protein
MTDRALPRETIPYGTWIRLKNGLSAKVLVDHGEWLYCSILISGWGDPLRYAHRGDIGFEPSPLQAQRASAGTLTRC